MKITINENDNLHETEVIINCPRTDENILKIISLLKVDDSKITGIKNGETFILSPQEILYCESVDKKTFFYTKTDVYETIFRLYELEEKLIKYDFFRATKSTIINLNRIKSFAADFGGRLIATMENGEKQYISRQYTKLVKDKLGL